MRILLLLLCATIPEYSGVYPETRMNGNCQSLLQSRNLGEKYNSIYSLSWRENSSYLYLYQFQMNLNKEKRMAYFRFSRKVSSEKMPSTFAVFPIVVSISQRLKYSQEHVSSSSPMAYSIYRTNSFCLSGFVWRSFLVSSLFLLNSSDIDFRRFFPRRNGTSAFLFAFANV